jgi:hypothetical protein
VSGLILDAPPTCGVRPAPDGPTLILPGRWRPLGFADIDALARYIHRRREGRGIVLTRRLTIYHGSDSFPGFQVSWQDAYGAEFYAFTACGVGETSERLEAALARNNPDIPSARDAA